MRPLTEKWKQLHPLWEYRLWTDIANREFIHDHFPEFLNKYDGYPYAIQRVDAIRYLLLYRYGGVYVDLDFECLKNIEPLIEGATCLLGREAEEQCQRNEKDEIIGNAFIACTPGHPFIKAICDAVCGDGRIATDNTHVLDTTGPFMLTRVYEQFAQKDSIRVLDADVLYPLGTEDHGPVRVRKATDPEMTGKLGNAYAVHHYWGSWWKVENVKTESI
jgi:mannosyltransferase OCH1-like enzyme